jgi:hypothetical protein
LSTTPSSALPAELFSNIRNLLDRELNLFTSRGPLKGVVADYYGGSAMEGQKGVEDRFAIIVELRDGVVRESAEGFPRSLLGIPVIYRTANSHDK